MPHRMLTSTVLSFILFLAVLSVSVRPAAASGAEVDIEVINNTQARYMVVLVSNGGMSPERHVEPGEKMSFPRTETRTSKDKTEWKIVFDGEGVGATQCRAFIRPMKGSYTVFKECVSSVVKIDYEVRDDETILFTLHQ